MPLALTGSLTAVQFCCPAELPLVSNKMEHFSKVSMNQVNIINLKSRKSFHCQPSPAQYLVTLIKYGPLSGGYGRLRGFEPDDG